MSKIEIAIKITSSGAQEPIMSARGPWVSQVRDVRDVFYHLDGFDGKFVTMLSFCPGGELLTVIRHISGRMTDNVAAWLYIPGQCAVSGQELVQLIADVKAFLSDSRIDPSAMNALVAKNYPDKAFPVAHTPSPADGGYAFRGTDFYSMADILGEGRYQDYYSRYKYIFLIDRMDTVLPKADVTDLTRTELVMSTILLPPPAEEVARVFGSGTSLVYETSSRSLAPFNSPLKLKRGSSFVLYANKEGFDRIPIMVQASEPVQQVSVTAGPAPAWQKKITYNQFMVLDLETRQPVPGAKILVNGTDVYAGLTLTDEQARSASVSVQASGYEPHNGTHFLGTATPVQILLRKGVSERKYRVVTKHQDEDAELVIRTRKPFEPGYVPLEGYVASRRDSFTLYPEDKKAWLPFLYGVLSTLALVAVAALVWWGISKFTGGEKMGNDPYYGKQTENSQGVPQDTESSAPEFDPAALNYLEIHDQWKRSEMEEIDGLKGLFDAMNTFEFEKVQDILEPYIDKSKEARFLYNATKECNKSKLSKPKFNQNSEDELISPRAKYIPYITGQSNRNDQQPAGAVGTRPQQGGQSQAGPPQPGQSQANERSGAQTGQPSGTSTPAPTKPADDL